MQMLAFDINKSETAFVRRTEVPNKYSIRWFSPTREVPLCGHATLASTKALYEQGRFDSIEFLYGEGSLRIRRDGDDGFIMSFPLDDYEKVGPEPIYRSFFPGIRIQECVLGKRTKKVVLRVDDALS
jgi:predicted PhzF superfamily epimerase YddE/YHI9